MLGLIATIGACFFVELVLIGPTGRMSPPACGHPGTPLSSQEPLYLAIGILGATVMPHNLYLHSSVVQTRVSGDDAASKRSAIRFSRLDTIGSLSPGAAGQCGDPDPRRRGFPRQRPYRGGGDQDAYHLLDPLVGGALASFLFGFALLAAGKARPSPAPLPGRW